VSVLIISDGAMAAPLFSVLSGLPCESSARAGTVILRSKLVTMPVMYAIHRKVSIVKSLV
jgi:hypothetical protein